MRQKSGPGKAASEKIVKDIRRATRKRHSAEEKIRIVLDGLRGEDSSAELCRREGIAQSLYYSWSKEFLEAGKKRLAGDMAREASSGEVEDLRREARALRELVAEQALEIRLLTRIARFRSAAALRGFLVASAWRFNARASCWQITTDSATAAGIWSLSSMIACHSERSR